MNPIDFDKYIQIINKLCNYDIVFGITEKIIFCELVEIIADTIWTVEKYTDKYPRKYYQQTKKYDQVDLDCCSSILDFLQNEIIRDNEDAYDDVVQKKFIEENNN